jgi:hypothetical protein
VLVTHEASGVGDVIRASDDEVMSTPPGDARASMEEVVDLLVESGYDRVEARRILLDD